MDIYARWFSRMGLIYLALGVVMGVVIGTQPEWSARLRFVHIHLNLLGFMTMMIAGVAYHVLPRFNARPVPWPGGVKVHFILHNTGLLGMSATHLAGGLWSGGLRAVGAQDRAETADVGPGAGKMTATTLSGPARPPLSDCVLVFIG